MGSAKPVFPDYSVGLPCPKDSSRVLAKEEGCEVFTSPSAFSHEKGAEWFVDCYGDRCVYIPEWKQWLIWTGTHWQPDGVQNVQNRYSKMVKDAYAICKVAVSEKNKAVVKFLTTQQNILQRDRSLKRAGEMLARSPDDFNNQLHRLPVLNGTIDYYVGFEEGHRKMDYFTQIVELDYVSNYRDSRVWRFLNEILPDAWMRDYVLRILGSGLTGLTKEPAFHYFFGRGRNGKSLLANLVLKVLGNFATSASLSAFEVHNSPSNRDYAIKDLMGKRLVVVQESSNVKRLDAGMLKAITGRDILPGREAYQRGYTKELIVATIIGLGNDALPVPGNADAVFDRLKNIHFRESFVLDPNSADKHEHKAERGIENTLEATSELEALLAVLVDGMINWRNKESFSPPKSVIEATERQRADSDVLQEWIDNRLEPTMRTSVSIPAAYADICKMTDEFRSQRSFSRALGKKMNTKDREHGIRVIKGFKIIGIGT